MTHQTLGDFGRPPEQGRFRLGVKTGSAMKHIDTLRLTSPDRKAIEEVAAQYGGNVTEWNDPRASPQNQFQVITPVKEMEVFLPPGGFSQWFESWGGKGCERRCDGVEMSLPEGQACLCLAQGRQVCRPYTRVQLLLPRVKFGGTWRLETKGKNAAEELKWVDAMVAQLASAGQIVQCVLSVEVRATWKEGKKHLYVVPKLSLAHSLVEIMQGEGTLAALGRADGPLQIAPTIEEVDDPVEQTPAMRALARGTEDEIVEKIEVLATRLMARHPGIFKEDDELVSAVVFQMSGGKLNHLEDCTETQRVKVLRKMGKIDNGEEDLPAP